MSNIRLENFTNGVELERRRLKNILKNKNLNISNNSSLTQLINHVQDITSDLPSLNNKHEVRFFDADGTQIGESIWVEDGGSVTPPSNPDIDPERLTFDRWASAIGNTFDNIKHDVDYGALYKMKNQSSYLLCEFDADTTINLKIHIGSTDKFNVNIDWGDNTNTVASASGTFTHTYTESGKFWIVLTPDKEITNSVNYNYYIEPSTAAYVFSSTLDLKILKAYLLMWYGTSTNGSFTYTSNCPYIIYEKSYWSYSVMYYAHNDKKDMLIIHNLSDSGSSTGNMDVCCGRCKRLIIDNTNSKYCGYSIGRNNSYLNFDKIIFPPMTNTSKTCDIFSGTGSNGGSNVHIDKVIGYNRLSATSGSVDTIEYIYSDGITISAVCKGVENLILPNNVNLNLPANFIGYSGIKNFTVTENLNCDVNAFQNSNLHNLYLYQNYAKSINLFGCVNLTRETYIDILNKIIDNAENLNLTITFDSLFLTQIKNFIYVKLNNGIYEYCNSSDEGAMLMIQAFVNKNWTVS